MIISKNLGLGRVSHNQINTEKDGMDLKSLDFIFPFFVLGYGILMVMALEMPALQKIAKERFPDNIRNQMHSHRILAWVSLIVGCFWSLQNIWIG